jgi:hypothetical protein
MQRSTLELLRDILQEADFLTVQKRSNIWLSKGIASLPALLLRNKIPQPAPLPWIPACAGMTERFVSAAVLSAGQSGGLAMTRSSLTQ